jgi:hypothetical protein
MMQGRKILTGCAVVVVALSCGTQALAAPSLETQDVQIIKTSGDTQFMRYMNAVRAQDKREAHAALLAKLRQMRDDLRNYAMIAKGGKMTDAQSAAVGVLKSIKDQTSALQAKDPGTNVDPQDNSSLDPLLFELGSN